MEKFKERLLAERTKMNVSQTVVAKAIGISWRAYQRYESGERWPTVPILVSLCNYFNISLDYLVGRTDNPEVNR